MRQIQIQVFQSASSRRDNQVLFERIIDLNDSLCVPYDNLVNSLKFMFGSSSIIQFSLL